MLLLLLINADGEAAILLGEAAEEAVTEEAARDEASPIVEDDGLAGEEYELEETCTAVEATREGGEGFEQSFEDDATGREETC